MAAMKATMGHELPVWIWIVLSLAMLSGMFTGCADDRCDLGGYDNYCPSDVDGIDPSDEYLAACGEEPVEVARDFWDARGDTRARLEYAAPGDRDGKHRAGTINLRIERKRGQARVIGATIYTDSCDPLVVTHEMGHAIGHSESKQEGTIMCEHTGCAGWEW